MAARPGEDNVATLFGDVHYFYGPETDNPPHHRFNKGSYVYLFENANEGRARIEIANRPGTEHQDAFDGYLDRTSVSYTYKHSCMVSLAVHDNIPNQDEWHLPTWDPHNQAIYHYQLRALDIYFWTPRDALLFVNGVRRVLPPAQLDIEDEPVAAAPPPPPLVQAPANTSNGLSHVVQKLENVALSGSGGSGGGSGRGSGRGSIGSGSQGGAPSAAPSAAFSFAPPPQAPVDAPAPGSQTSMPSNQQAAQQPVFAPFAYNPAAPPAPETIRPREKTPPPEEFGGAHPLHQTLAYDAATPFSPGLVVPAGMGPLSPGVPPPSFHTPPGVPAFPGPPVYTGSDGAGGGYPPASHPSLARAATMPISSSAPFGGPVFLPPPTAAKPAGPVPPAVTTAPAVQAPQQAAHPQNAAVAIAGYSQYSYANQAASPGLGAGMSGYAVHQQLYRPTEGETAKAYKPKQEPRGKLEEVGGRLDKGVTGVLKRFEKRFG